MKILIDNNNNKYIDQALFDYLNNIWITYDINIANDSNIMFCKNTTINRLITDYNNTGISRVIKKEKADYLVVNRIHISNYPQYYDNGVITQDDTKEVVYGIYNNSCEDRDTIELILDFHNRGQQVKFVNQNKLNESLNNGFILDKESYTLIKELLDSEHADNHKLAVNMLVNSDLKSNWEWILYICQGKASRLFDYDKKSIINNYFNTLALGLTLSQTLSKIDNCLAVIKNPDVIERFNYKVKDAFNKNFESYMRDVIGTSKFQLQDFKLKLKNE